MGKLINEVGNRYGRLVVLERDENSRCNHAQWKCVCDCGNQTVVLGKSLRKGRTQSCSCLQKDLLTEANLIHGHARTGNKTYLHSLWRNMKDRCYNLNNKDYHSYGGRGISVYEPWRCGTLVAKKFIDWILVNLGHRPTPQHSIDRIDSNGNYVPGNLRWSTDKEQGNNKRSNISADTKLGVVAGREFGMTYVELGKTFGISFKSAHRICNAT